MLTNCEKNTALGVLIRSCSTAQLRALKEQIDPYFQLDFISQLPKEVCSSNFLAQSAWKKHTQRIQITMKVLNYLSPADLVRVSSTCRAWRSLSEDAVLWRQKFPEHQAWPPKSSLINNNNNNHNNEEKCGNLEGCSSSVRIFNIVHEEFDDGMQNNVIYSLWFYYLTILLWYSYLK